MNLLSQVTGVATADVEAEDDFEHLIFLLQQKSAQVERAAYAESVSGTQQCRLHAIDMFIYRIITL